MLSAFEVVAVLGVLALGLTLGYLLGQEPKDDDWLEEPCACGCPHFAAWSHTRKHCEPR